MNSKLKQIKNWPELAAQANWLALALANNCAVSPRTLERHFLKEMGNTPKDWLAEQRQLHAIKLLRESSSVKETAARLGYKYASNFTRKFKTYWGSCPTTKTDNLGHYKNDAK